jgi:DUF1707 SHOCT-like domain
VPVDPRWPADPHRWRTPQPRQFGGPGPRDERIGNAQRTRVLELLGKATEEGYLSLDEYDQRAVAVTTARMRSELLAVVWDLPAQFRWDPRTTPPRLAPAKGPDRQAFATAALALGLASIPLAPCLLGGLLGLAAVLCSIPGSRGGAGSGRAVIGRILGLVGVAAAVVVLILIVTSSAQN